MRGILDGVLQFLATLAIYFVIFAAIGMVFYAIDRRVKAYLRRPAHCAFCNAEFDPAGGGKGAGTCPTCGRRQPRAKST